jgi:hypothetical protein
LAILKRINQLAGAALREAAATVCAAGWATIHFRDGGASSVHPTPERRIFGNRLVWDCVAKVSQCCQQVVSLPRETRETVVRALANDVVFAAFLIAGALLGLNPVVVTLEKVVRHDACLIGYFSGPMMFLLSHMAR